MILIEFIKFLRSGFLVRKPKFIRGFTDIKNKQKRYIESFTFNKYLYKNIVFKENKILTLLIIISLSFVLIMIYHFICFILYTIDLYITFMLKFFFDTIVFVLEQWETSIYEKIYIYRRDPILSKRYKKEQAVSAQRKIKFFTKWISYLTKDLNNCLNFEIRNYSVLIKYFKYFYVFFDSFFKWFISSVKYYIPMLFLKFNDWLLRVVVIYYGSLFLYHILYMFIYFIYMIILVMRDIFYFIYYKIYTIYFRIKFKIVLYRRFYVMKKNARILMYNHVYSAYYKYYKRYTLFESFFFKQFFSDKMADDIIINTIVFKFVNFRILYYIHRFIKPMPYFIFLENTYDFLNKTNNGDILLVMRDLKPFFTRNWIFLLIRISKICVFISPYFEKYYIILDFYIRKYINIFLYYMYVIIRFFIVLPKFLVRYPIVPLNENIFIIVKFIKIFFRK